MGPQPRTGGSRPAGRPGTYTNDGCRCEQCRAAHAAYQARLRAAKRANPDPDRIPHGTVGGYDNWSCRCEACTRASREALRRRRRGELTGQPAT